VKRSRISRGNTSFPPSRQHGVWQDSFTLLSFGETRIIVPHLLLKVRATSCTTVSSTCICNAVSQAERFREDVSSSIQSSNVVYFEEKARKLSARYKSPI
jgi:hypothetical protein